MYNEFLFTDSKELKKEQMKQSLINSFIGNTEDPNVYILETDVDNGKKKKEVVSAPLELFYKYGNKGYLSDMERIDWSNDLLKKLRIVNPIMDKDVISHDEYADVTETEQEKENKKPFFPNLKDKSVIATFSKSYKPNIEKGFKGKIDYDLTFISDRQPRAKEKDVINRKEYNVLGLDMDKKDVYLRTAKFALKHPSVALRIGACIKKDYKNISSNSYRFATIGGVLTGVNSKVLPDEGSENGAFRHALWQATITSEFTPEIAEEAGNAHEKNPNKDLNRRLFFKLSEADETADLLNNIIGRSVGSLNKGRTMKELAFKILDEFYYNGLYTVVKNTSGFYKVIKTPISKEKYEQLKRLYNETDVNGFTTEELNLVNDRKKNRIDRGYLQISDNY